VFWNFLKQSRKMSTDVIFITQSLKNLEGQIARLVQYVWRFRDMEQWGIQAIRLRWPFPQILQVCFDYAGEVQTKRLWTKDKELFRCYNTNALYAPFARPDRAGIEGIAVKRIKREAVKIPAVAFAVLFLVLLLVVLW
jgi:hypothetical protein